MSNPTDAQRRPAAEVAAHRHRTPQPTRPAPEAAVTPAATHTLTAPCGRAIAHVTRRAGGPRCPALVTVARRQPLRVGRVDDLVPGAKVNNGVMNFPPAGSFPPTEKRS